MNQIALAVFLQTISRLLIPKVYKFDIATNTNTLSTLAKLSHVL